MKLRHAFMVFALVFGYVAAAEKKPEGPRIRLVVDVERVRDDSLLVRIVSYGEPGAHGTVNVNHERSNAWAVLTPGGKCAAGDKFEVWARESGIQKEAGYGSQPLRRYTVISAKRL